MDTLQKAAKFIHEGDKSAARKMLVELLRKKPKLDHAWYLLSFAFDQQDRKIQVLRQALKINPDHKKASQRLDRILKREKGSPDPSSRVSEKVLLKEAASHLKVGNLGTARALTRYVLRENKNNEFAWYLLSFCVRERYQKISALAQAVKINPDLTEAQNQLDSLQGISQEPETREISKEKRPTNNFLRIAKFTSVRFLTLAVAVIIGVFLTTLIATKGTVIESEIRGNLLKGWLGGAMGSLLKFRIPYTGNQDFSWIYGGAETALQRALVLLFKGLTFNLGKTEYLMFYTGRQNLGSVYEIILEFLPRTLLLFGTTNIFLFFVSVWFSLRLSRRHGYWLDRLITYLNPLSSVPSWVYGLLLTVLFVNKFHFFSGGRLESWPTEFSFQSILAMGKKLLVPVLAIFISKFFQSVYTWRTFFLIYSTEDYVDMAKAKGLSNAKITRRYILRPTLPIVLTRFSMILISIWQEAIIIELFFSVAGIGHLFYQSLLVSDMPLIVGLVVTFAYSIAISVFALDFLYAIVDPRVRVGPERKVGSTSSRSRFLSSLQSFLKGLGKRFGGLFQKRSPNFSLQSFFRSVRNRYQNVMGVAKELRRGIGDSFKQILSYPTAVVGLSIISLLILVSIITVIAIPYPRAVEMWRNEEMWAENPSKAQPVWTNIFRSRKLPHTISIGSEREEVEKTVEAISDTRKEIGITFRFDYPYQGFPKDIVLQLESEFDQKHPFITLNWKTPQGRVEEVKRFSIPAQKEVRFSEEKRLSRILNSEKPHQVMFSEFFPDYDDASQGTYQLTIEGIGFDEDFDLEAKLIVFGQVHGMAGTDHKRRNLGLALLWGTPLALGFGIVASLANSLITMFIAALGTWFGGWLDILIQRINDVNMIIPIFPILLMVFNWFSNRLWVILGVYILLGIFGAGIKTYRSAFLQVREMPYIEAARSYGAGNFRLIFLYLVPRTMSILIPQFINMVPTIVFLEATLAYLNMSDPLLPTWGKVIREAFSYGGLSGNYYWYWWLEPIGLMILTASGFLLLGSALERIFDPKLQKP
ncbi:MAG: ABC transporter permease subunit [Anaerolineales bacterium]